jgi:hypothetical protein
MPIEGQVKPSAERLGFSLQLPTAWFEFDPTQDDLAAELQRILGARITDPVRRAHAIAALAPLALQMRAAAINSGLLLTAGFASVDPADRSDTPLVLSGVLAIARLPELDPNESVSVLDLLERARDAGKTSSLESVELPAGGAFLTTAELEMTDDSWEVPARFHSRRYLLRVPGNEGWMALLFATPNLALSGEFDELFDVLARSFEFLQAEPTEASRPA